MLVECGFVRATLGDGAEYTFTPSLGRIASLGAPRELVAMFAALHGPDAEKVAPYVLAGLCDQDDLTELIGEAAPTPKGVEFKGGAMPPAEQLVIARHLMMHGMVGRPKPAEVAEASYCDAFNAAEYIAAARAHLGMSAADAEALSMTELQLMLEMKFPDATRQAASRDIPTAEEYEATMKAFEERRGAT